MIMMPVFSQHLPANNSRSAINIGMVDFSCEIYFWRLLWVVIGELDVEGESAAFVRGVVKAMEGTDPFEDIAVFEVDVVALCGTFAQALELFLEAFFGRCHDSGVEFERGKVKRENKQIILK